MSWQYKIVEVNIPSLNSVRVAFMLQKDGSDYVGDEIVLQPNELIGTAEEKQAIIASKIGEKVNAYIAVAEARTGLDDLIGTVTEV